ncbi:metal ABC transporter ATP-binding protein [Candidatus Bathyarchaeota archaeon]|nr:MAG: metal ABC transporter ATP-binding protein [Candidatus Bathyarchaeota archaeon]
MEIILKNLSAGYNSPILTNITLSFKGNGLIQIIGPNGAGKTTLLKTILGLIKPIDGKVIVRCKKIGYVPQKISLEKFYPLTAWELVLNTLLLYSKKWPRFVGKSENEKVEKALEAVKLGKEKWNELFSELSGGERQRVLIAMAIVHEPDLLILDEPLSSLDPLGRVEMSKFIGKLAQEKLILIACHDPTLLLPYTKYVLLLNKNYYAFGKPEEILKTEILKNVYGDAVIEIEHAHIV